MDLVSSYTVIIPWHPANGMNITQPISNLLGPTLRSNGKLCRLSKDIIVRDNLWIRAELFSPILLSQFQIMQKFLPILPPLYLTLLPNVISRITVRLEDQRIVDQLGHIILTRVRLSSHSISTLSLKCIVEYVQTSRTS